MDRVNSYNSEIDMLFTRWKSKVNDDKSINHKDSIFVRDGVVYPEHWFSQPIRPLFLLKEAYNGKEDWDLCEDHLLLTQKKMSQMWINVSHWTKGLFNTTADYIYKYTDNMTSKYYGNEQLNSIAVINVKKSSGKSNSSMEEINRYAEFDKNELFREIELCDPTIIICGYTISSLNIIVGFDIKDYDHPNDNWFYTMKVNNHDVIVLDYYHPASQMPYLISYYGLMCIYQQALLQ